MSRPVSAEPRVRLNLDLPSRVRERMERVRVMSEADSLTEVVRRAISIYETLLTTANDGGRIVLHVGGVERELLIK